MERAPLVTATCCCWALFVASGESFSLGAHKIFNEGKCCRATVAASIANSASPSMTKPSKLSPIRIATTSAIVRTTRVSVSSVKSKIESNRSSKTGSGFKIRTRVSTKRAGVWRPAKQDSCPSVVGNEGLTHPDALRRWCRKRARRDLVRRTEVDLGDLRKHLWPVLLHDVSRSGPDFTRRPTAQLHPKFLSLPLKPIDECFTRQNRCRCHRNVRFRARALLDLNLLAMTQ